MDFARLDITVNLGLSLLSPFWDMLLGRAIAGTRTAKGRARSSVCWPHGTRRVMILVKRGSISELETNICQLKPPDREVY
jgi:hypothetical protein